MLGMTGNYEGSADGKKDIGQRHTAEFIVGQKSVARDSNYEKSIDTMRKLPASNSKQEKGTTGENTYETNPDKNLEDSLQNSVIVDSPIDKYNLVYTNQKNVSAF